MNNYYPNNNYNNSNYNNSNYNNSNYNNSNYNSSNYNNSNYDNSNYNNSTYNNSNYNNSNYNNSNYNNSNYNNSNYNNSNYNNSTYNYSNYDSNNYNSNCNTGNSSYNNNFNNGYNYQNTQPEDDFETWKPIVTEFNETQSVSVENVIAKSFLFMFVALIISAVAAATTSIETMAYLVSSGAFYGLLVGEVVIALISGFVVKKNKPIIVAALYIIYSYINGITMSIIFVLYTMTSITNIFMFTAGLFGVMALYGLFTKKDLSSMGSICFMALLGLVGSGLLNVFLLHNSVVEAAICSIGVLVFVGLAAYDTQKIKAYAAYANEANETILALEGGFELYLDFVNLFLKLLRIFGKRK